MQKTVWNELCELVRKMDNRKLRIKTTPKGDRYYLWIDVDGFAVLSGIFDELKIDESAMALFLKKTNEPD